MSLLSHDNILHNIIGRLEDEELINCLRVSFDFFLIAGKYLYAELHFPPNQTSDRDGHATAKLFLGHDAITPNIMRVTETQSKINFKRLLLSNVRRLTVLLHSNSCCTEYTGAATYFDNLDVLTVLPPRVHLFNSIRSMCRRPIDSESFTLDVGPQCKFMPGLSPRHLIFRNLGRDGLPRAFVDRKADSRLKSVTYVLPLTPYLAPRTERAQDHLLSILEIAIEIPLGKQIARAFKDCPSVRLVFLDDRQTMQDYMLEGMEDRFLDVDEEGEAFYNLPPNKSLSTEDYISEADFIGFMRSALSGETMRYQVYGMEWACVGSDTIEIWDRARDSAFWDRMKEKIMEKVNNPDRIEFFSLQEFLKTCPPWEIDEMDRANAEVYLDYNQSDYDDFRQSDEFDESDRGDDEDAGSDYDEGYDSHGNDGWWDHDGNWYADSEVEDYYGYEGHNFSDEDSDLGEY